MLADRRATNIELKFSRCESTTGNNRAEDFQKPDINIRNSGEGGFLGDEKVSNLSNFTLITLY